MIYSTIYNVLHIMFQAVLSYFNVYTLNYSSPYTIIMVCQRLLCSIPRCYAIVIVLHYIIANHILDVIYSATLH